MFHTSRYKLIRIIDGGSSLELVGVLTKSYSSTYDGKTMFRIDCRNLFEHLLNHVIVPEVGETDLRFELEVYDTNMRIILLLSADVEVIVRTYMDIYTKEFPLELEN